MTSFNAEEMLPSSNQPVNNSSPAACDGIMESNIQPEKLSDVIDALAALLRDSVDIHRCSAARALGEIKSDQAT